MTIVRIVLADPRTRRPPGGGAVNSQHLIVLADTVLAEDGGHRAVPLWLRGLDFKLLWWLLDTVSAPGTARDAVMAGVVMDRLAAPVHGEDVHAPFLLPSAVRPPGDPERRQGFEPRNMAFTDGLDRWKLAGSFLDAGRPHWQDYSRAAADRSAILASAVSEPSGSAVLFQEIYADDYRGRTVTFRGQLRTIGVAGQAGLHLAAGQPVETPGEQLRERGGSSLTDPGGSDWTWHEVTMPVPGDATVIRFGISLAGRGRIELRGAELSPARPETQE